MQLDPDHCYAALKARDTRFDGLFFVGVSMTGIYCRPVCAVRMPGRDRCTFYSNAAAAERAGFRPCLRCRPELAPGAAPLDAARRVSALAVARIEAGALADVGMEALAADLSLSSRQLRRIVKREYGVTPVELAQTCRLLLAKQLLTDTRLKIADIAFASGFSSVRRFNHLFVSRYRLKPTELRRNRKLSVDADAIPLRLGYRPPLAWSALIEFLVRRGAACVEARHGNRYVRAVRIGRCTGWIAARPDTRRDLIHVDLLPSLLPVLTPLRARLRHLFDLNANPAIVDAHLTQDVRLAEHVRVMPGLRVPGAMDGFELALRAVLGQQISVAAASTIFARFCTQFGEPLDTPFAGLDRLPPTAASIAEATPNRILACGVTRRRGETVQALARAMASGALRLEPSADRERNLAALSAISGIGPWTTQYVAMRALADPDAFPERDLVLRKALHAGQPDALETAAEAWRPWRAYAAMHWWRGVAAGG